MNLNLDELKKLGTELRRKFDEYKNDRAELEKQWLKNLRQYRGKYDPEIEMLIPADKSKVYPRDTRVKGIGFVAKMMELMFPATERNWELTISPYPNIAEADLEQIIAQLQAEEQMRAMEEGRDPQPIPSLAIEEAVRVFATERKERMEKEIEDQLSDPEVDFPSLCKRVVRSGWLYGAGILRAPMVRTQIEREWVPDPETGEYIARKKKRKRPYPEFVRIWDAYPDLTAPSWSQQEGFFERIVLTRHSVYALSRRPDFLKEAIREYLALHQSGNFREQPYEKELAGLGQTENIGERESRKYEIIKFTGFVSAHQAARVGIEVPEEEMHSDIFVEVWMLDDVIIKADTAPFGEKVSDVYHAFIYAEDEDAGLTGIGGPEELRDSQMSLCSAMRALMDNMAAVAGPIFEVNEELLTRGRDIGPIHSFKTIYREGIGSDANVPAVRQISTESHVEELLAIVDLFTRRMDIESNLPSWTLGNNPQQLGEAFRTTSNMSMMTGGANMLTKDVVRSFDNFTESVIGAMLKWNMEFGDKREIKGDFQVKARGNLSLVAKEVRGAALDQFMATLSPEERAMLKTYDILIDRLKARDLPTDRIVSREEAAQILDQMRQAQARAAQVEQGLTQAKTQKSQAEAEATSIKAQIEAGKADMVINELAARAEALMAKAQNDQEKNQMQIFQMMLNEMKTQAPSGAQSPTTGGQNAAQTA